MIPTEEIDLVVIEDSPNDVELIMRALKSVNLANRVHVSRDGRQALDYLFKVDENGISRLAHTPKVILLDLKLPKVNGIEVLKTLKSDERTKEIPVVMLTSSQETKDLDACYSLGANSYIVKPFGFDQFAKAVAEAGLYWLVVNQPPIKVREGLGDGN